MILAAPAAALPPRFVMTLAEAESSARAHSPRLKAAAEESAGARDRAESQFAPLLPRLTLDGSYRYATEVPSLALAPGQPARPFGDHRATSLGPTLSWTLWDEGALLKGWKSQKARAASKEEEERLAAGQAVLGARLAYAQAQLAREQFLLLADSLALALAQYKDIESRFKAGAASRIDVLSSHQDALSRQIQLLQAQSDLAGALRELLQLTGRGDGRDLSRPSDPRVSTAAAAGLKEPTLLVELDDLSVPPVSLPADDLAGPDAENPRVSILRRQAESARLAARGMSAGRWPVVRLSARVSRDYPNGPVLESVTQKSVGLTASLPLFEGRQTARAAREISHQAAAAERRGDLASEELSRDWDQARATLGSLREQEAVDERSVAETDELARLVYLSYKAGRSNYLEVQNANLRALESKVSAARTRVQVRIQLSILADLAPRG